MQRWLTIGLGALALVLAVALAWQGMTRWRPPAEAKHPAIVEAGVPMAVLDLDAGFDPLPAPRFEHSARDGGAGFTMLDGTPAPLLPPGSPRVVRFGVVLVSYAGAEDAPRTTRSKHDALETAEKLAAQAKDDFHAAVRRGDDGSADDVGTLQRGVIEPAPEYVLFSLPVGGTSDPIDTPRGYWIVKRIE